MTKMELASAFLREPGAVEARQTAAGESCPFRAEILNVRPVGVFVQAASMPRAYWSLKRYGFAVQF